LIEGIDVPAIEAKIAQYQEENAEQIMINRARKVLEKEYYVSAPNFCHFIQYKWLRFTFYAFQLMPWRRTIYTIS
jgi:hypothetical protein